MSDEMFKGRSGRLQLIFLGLKVVFGVLFASHFLYGLFVPFLNFAVEEGTGNPWQAAIDHNLPNAFPYGPIMFYFMMIPRLLLNWAVPKDPMAATWVHLLAARIPLLVADVAILSLLIKGLKTGITRATLLWWASPIVLYITYVHGQLDVIPTAMLLASLVLLMNGRYLWAAVVLGLGLATKLHLLVALPFMAVFAMRKERSWQYGVSFLGITLCIYCASLFPWGLSSGFRAMVFGTQEQGRLFQVTLDYVPTLKVYLAPLIIGLLILQFASYKKVNHDTLLMFLGLAYTVLIAVIPPAHGYYVWPLPFVVYFFAQETTSFSVPLWAFNICSLAYLILGLDSTLFESASIIFPQTLEWGTPVQLLEQYGLSATMMNSLLYTSVQVSVLAIFVMMYRYGVQQNIIYRPRLTPILVGIGGDSGTGKHTARDILADILGNSNLVTVDGDDTHKWERGHQMWKSVTHLNPGANDLYLQLSHAKALGRGQTISKARYLHSEGKFSQPTMVSSSRFVFIVGLHPFYLKRMRDMMDIRIYMEPDKDLQIAWKVDRDVRERGYTPSKVREQLSAREADAACFIMPQRQFADMVVRYYTLPLVAGTQHTREDPLGIQVMVDNSLPFDAFADRLRKSAGLKVSLHHEDDLIRQTLNVEGTVTAGEIRSMASQIFPQVNELVAARAKWAGGHNGILQLSFLVVLSELLQDGGDAIYS